jgi:hypothetical protein
MKKNIGLIILVLIILIGYFFWFSEKSINNNENEPKIIIDTSDMFNDEARKEFQKELAEQKSKDEYLNKRLAELKELGIDFINSEDSLGNFTEETVYLKE